MRVTRAKCVGFVLCLCALAMRRPVRASALNTVGPDWLIPEGKHRPFCGPMVQLTTMVVVKPDELVYVAKGNCGCCAPLITSVGSAKGKGLKVHESELECMRHTVSE